MNDEIMRKMPFSHIAEQSLLGSVLIDPDSLNEVADMVNASDFYITEHTQIYLAMHELFLTNSEIDVVTLIDTLVRKGIYDKSGGEDYIRTLIQIVPNALNIKVEKQGHYFANKGQSSQGYGFSSGHVWM